MKTQSLAQNIISKMRDMSERNKALEMPVASILALHDIANGVYPYDFIICTNGDRHRTWIDVIPASAKVGHKFKDIESVNGCLSFLSHVTVLGWYASGVGEEVLYVPVLENKKDFYSPSLKKV